MKTRKTVLSSIWKGNFSFWKLLQEETRRSGNEIAAPQCSWDLSQTAQSVPTARSASVCRERAMHWRDSALDTLVSKAQLPPRLRQLGDAVVELEPTCGRSSRAPAAQPAAAGGAAA